MTTQDSRSYSALMFNEQTSGDREEVEKLRATPGVLVSDLYAAQLAELASLRAVVAAERAEPPRWVYYPWRTTLCRILGPQAYRRLRLDRNRNKITPSEQQYYAGLTIGVVGASVGHQIALGLALEGLCGTLRLADFDTVELSNLNRLPGSILDYGLNKTVVAARRIAELDRYLAVEPYLDGIDLDSTAAFITGSDIVIEVCDSIDVKLAVREQARTLGVPVLMVTSDRGTVDVERFDLDPTRAPFHGLIGGLTAEALSDLPSAAKVPFVMNIVGADGLSPRMAASMLEIDQSLTTWPHLAGDALQAAAAAVMTVRSFARHPGPRSGRLHIDIASRLDDLTDPIAPTQLPAFIHPGNYRNLPTPTTNIEAVVRAAQLAPSGGNCQPWHITVHGNTIDIDLDPEQTTAMDVEFRASYLAIGAAIQNMRIAAAEHALLADVEILPNAPNTSPVATATLHPGRDERLAADYQPMLHRVTNRHPGESNNPITAGTLERLIAATHNHGAELNVITTPEALAEAADILTDTDRLRYLIPTLHREMMSELRDPRTGPIDRGIDIRTLEMGPAAPILGIIRRSDVMAELAAWNAGHALGTRVGTLITSAAGLAAITIPHGTPADYVRGGHAMQSVWIAATAAGLAAQPVVPLFTFTHTDAELTALAGPYTDRIATAQTRLHTLLHIPHDHHIAMILRLSHAPAPTAVSLRSPQTHN